MILTGFVVILRGFSFDFEKFSTLGPRALRGVRGHFVTFPRVVWRAVLSLEGGVLIVDSTRGERADELSCCLILLAMVCKARQGRAGQGKAMQLNVY